MGSLNTLCCAWVWSRLVCIVASILCALLGSGQDTCTQGCGFCIVASIRCALLGSGQCQDTQGCGFCIVASILCALLGSGQDTQAIKQWCPFERACGNALRSQLRVILDGVCARGSPCRYLGSLCWPHRNQRCNRGNQCVCK